MKLKVIMNTRNKSEEVFIDGINVGIFERLNLDSKAYSFMSNCSLEKLTGDHYIRACNRFCVSTFHQLP